MKFFLDTAEVDEIRRAHDTGLLDGVTTNPSLVAKTGRSYESIISEICELCRGPVSAEVLSQDFDGMLNEARKWAKVADNVVVKLPLTADGLRVVRICSQEGIATNVTLCFSMLQALAAAKVGATFISPFVGRIEDMAQVGAMGLVEDTLTAYRHFGLTTQVLVASVRSCAHVAHAAKLGAHCATIPPKIFHAVLDHPLTTKGLAIFTADAARIPAAENNR